MRIWGRKPQRADQVAVALGPLAGRIESLRLPCAVIEPASGTPSVRGSYIGGHPYRPAGVPWPSDDEGPMSFVCQLAFADLPALPGFPRDGIFQWFLSNEDTYGLTFDETQGQTGHHVDWFADPSAPGVAEPTAPTPVPADAYRPTTSIEPIALAFRADVDLPCWDELEVAHPDLAGDPAWDEIEQRLGDERQLLWTEHIRAADRSRVGGYPNFTQFDPREQAGLPRLIVELDSQDGLTEWGDGGIGHLFGDPGRLAAGDVSGITYHWDCR